MPDVRSNTMWLVESCTASKTDWPSDLSHPNHLRQWHRETLKSNPELPSDLQDLTIEPSAPSVTSFEITEPAPVPARNGLVSLDPTVKTMSSLEIAEVTRKTYFNVVRDIEKVLNAAGVGTLKFEDTYTDPQNKQTYKCYNLPRLECDLVITGYSVPYRLKVIQR